MKKYFFPGLVLGIGVILAVGLFQGNSLLGNYWPLLSAVLLCLALMAFFCRFEGSSTSAKDVAVIATMASLAAIARVPFAIIPGFQPTTFMVMITGYVFGAQTGFLTGAIAALVSNLFLGQGPWTPWQMFCWGLTGVSAAVLAHGKEQMHLGAFTVLGGLWGYLFGWIMNIWHWVGFVYPLNLQTFIATYIASFAFDTLHAVANVIFALLLGKTFYQILLRFKNKLTVTYSNQAG
ncbi:ECF transporter S component [Bacillota bacterium LX-D]|nr:ECF transporter S component [Bacillota bacterium LX-D]